MQMQDHLPAILTFAGKQSGLSVYRALKQARELLSEKCIVETEQDEDRLQASLDDLQLMMDAVN